LVIIALAVAAGPAQSRSLQIVGMAGYLSEWEFRGEVTEQISSDGRELSGRLVWKHVGLCSIKGPQDELGEIRARISRLGAVAKIEAAILFNGARCAYSGQLSGSSSGYMDCSDASGIPLSISIKWRVEGHQAAVASDVTVIGRELSPASGILRMHGDCRNLDFHVAR
jgi:hypothetical protein